MKNLAIQLALLCAVSGSISSQSSNPISTQAVKKGDNIVNLYYGTNLLGAVYKRIILNDVNNAVQVKSMGPIGLVYEKMVSDKVGLGAEIGYSQVRFHFTDEVTTTNGQSMSNNVYNYNYKFEVLRIQFRANFHFASDEKFDFYALVSAGYKAVLYTFTSDDPLVEPSTYPGLIPFGVKPGMGFRYFFNPNVGLNIEFAAGTPLMCGGLTFKF